ncbi:MAG TPA: MFS transporter [Syntrophobacteria bacterium]|nr:MFS transporter [Syntrophobacteria bacterium]
MVHWKKNLAVVWVSQFLSIMGFFFAFPFAPYYIQELGVRDPVKLKLWVSLFGAAAPFSLAICSPIWGAMADRYGRRLMLLRANFGAAVVLTLMATVRSVEGLIVLRLLQGLLSGTVTAAQTMVTSSPPENRSGTALGALSAAVYSGTMAGAFLGGISAEYFGYRCSFLGSGLLLQLAGLLIVVGTREEFVPPPPQQDAGRVTPAAPGIALAVPLLLLTVTMSFCRQYDYSLFPLLVQEIHGSIQGAAFWTGSISAVAGLAGFLAGIVFGRLADRVDAPRLAKVSSVGAALFMVPQGLLYGFLILFPTRFGMIFCAGGLEPVFQVWLAKVTSVERRGSAFGWAATARSVGWVGAPLVSGLIASGFGLRSIYLVGGVQYLLLLMLIGYVGKRLANGPAANR